MKLQARLFALVAVGCLFAFGDAHAQSKQACIKAHESSQVLRKNGQLRAARAEILVCSQDACPEIVRTACVQWLDQVDKSTPTVVLEAKDTRGQPTSAVHVKIDDKDELDHLDGRAIALDPGEHAFRFTGAGGAVREERVVVPEGQKNRLVVADFEVKTPPPTPPPPPPSVDLGDVDRLAAARSQRTVGFVVGGIGVFSVAVGTIFGIGALSAANDAKCGSPCYADDGTKLADAHSSYENAKTSAWISNITLGVGLVALAAGAYLILSAKVRR